MAELKRIQGVGPALARALEAHGYRDARAVADARPDDIQMIRGVGARRATRLIAAAQALVQALPAEDPPAALPKSEAAPKALPKDRNVPTGMLAAEPPAKALPPEPATAGALPAAGEEDRAVRKARKAEEKARRRHEEEEARARKLARAQEKARKAAERAAALAAEFERAKKKRPGKKGPQTRAGPQGGKRPPRPRRKKEEKK
ncbi:helix-hairpin-helix domain-containing protein [Jhaorihella thermophila]